MFFGLFIRWEVGRIKAIVIIICPPTLRGKGRVFLGKGAFYYSSLRLRFLNADTRVDIAFRP